MCGVVSERTCAILPDKRWTRPSLGYTGRWCHRGWSGCCRSWALACSPSPDLLWNRTYSCRSGRSPVQERGHLVSFDSNWKSTTNDMRYVYSVQIIFDSSLTTELWHIESAVQPPLLGPLHSSMSSQTWFEQNDEFKIWNHPKVCGAVVAWSLTKQACDWDVVGSAPLPHYHHRRCPWARPL